MYHTDEFHEIADYIRAFTRGIGVEVFPLFHDPEFEDALTLQMNALEGLPISFHGPYYQAEHSAPEGTEEFERTMRMVRKTLDYSRLLKSRYLVYHHNNVRVDPEKKDEMIRISWHNYQLVKEMFRPYGIAVAVENVGVHERGNVLFEQDAFTWLCRREQCPVLIDIGHAHANGWDLPKLMTDLRGQIISYHLHNNDGHHDSHQRIHNGTLDFGAFLRAWRRNGRMTDWVLEYAHDVIPDREGIVEDILFLQKEYHL